MDIISVDDTIAEDLDIKIMSEKARKGIMTVLDKREKEIIVYRYGLDGDEPLTQRELAKKLDMGKYIRLGKGAEQSGDRERSSVLSVLFTKYTSCISVSTLILPKCESVVNRDWQNKAYNVQTVNLNLTTWL
jgi:dsRNA-specific ribonuclease